MKCHRFSHARVMKKLQFWPYRPRVMLEQYFNNYIELGILNVGFFSLCRGPL